MAAIDPHVDLDGLVAPHALEPPSCKTRRTLLCMTGLMSPTSSRNSVPPEHCSNFPIRWPSAPVKAPFFVAEQLAFQERLGNGRRN